MRAVRCACVCGKCDSGRWPGKSILAEDPGLVFLWKWVSGLGLQALLLTQMTTHDYLYRRRTHKPARKGRCAVDLPRLLQFLRAVNEPGVFVLFVSISQNDSCICRSALKIQPIGVSGSSAAAAAASLSALHGLEWVFSHINYWTRIPGCEFTVYCLWDEGIFPSSIGGWTLGECQISLDRNSGFLSCANPNKGSTLGIAFTKVISNARIFSRSPRSAKLDKISI